MDALRRIACVLADGTPERAPEIGRDLLDVALAHSPRVEEAGPGLVYLDVAGLRGLYGSEEDIGRRLARTAADRGRKVRVGIARSRIGALIAARRGCGVTVVEPEMDGRYLAPAPISLLDLTEEMTARLRRWGIRTLGELAALPSPALFERLGSEGIALQRLARGEDSRPLRPWEPPMVFEESIEPGWAVDTLGPLGDLIATLVERVCERLVRRGVSADHFDWICRLADGTIHEGRSTPAVPVNEAPAVVALIRSSLESRPPRGAVESVTLRAHPARVVHAQTSLTDLSRPSPRLLTTVLTRLAALVGAQELGIPVLLDSHRPDAVMLVPPHPDPSRSFALQEKQGGGPLALRRFRPPLSACVTLTAGRPAHLQSDRLTARIVASAGPWRSSGAWWSEPWRRDEWDAELPDGTLCRLTHDGTAWWLEGIYD